MSGDTRGRSGCPRSVTGSTTKRPGQHKGLVRGGLAGLAVMGITALVFLPCLDHDFIRYDDHWFVVDNPVVARGITGYGVIYAWTTGQMGYPKPLTILSWMTDAELYGLDAWGFHLTNVLLHAGATGFVFAALVISTGSAWRAAIAALLWGIHPLRVESVAWVAERKDVLAGLFGFAAWAMYALAVRKRSRPVFWGSVFAFALSLLAKPIFVTLPVLLLLWDWWPLARLRTPPPGRRLLGLAVEKLPYAGLAAGLAIWVLLSSGSAGGAPELGARLANALVSYCRYLAKMVDLDGLALLYPRLSWPVAAWSSSAGVLVVASAWILWRRAIVPALCVGWLWFLLAMVPMLQIVPFGDFAMADRFTYLPAVGLAVAIVWSVPPAVRLVTRLSWAGAGLAVLAVLVVFTQAQLGYWRGTVPLFRHTLAVTAPNPQAEFVLANAYRAQDRHNEAIAHYRNVAWQRPGHVVAWTRLGEQLDARGSDERARDALERAYQAAVQQTPKPKMIAGLAELGRALLRAGEQDRAERIFARADTVAGSSHDAKALANLANGFRDLDRFERAKVLYRRALRLQPSDPHALNNFGQLAAQQGRVGKAARLFHRALANAPDHNAKIRFNLAWASHRLGKLALARRHLQRVLRERPNWAKAHLELGRVLSTLGDDASAGIHYREALAGAAVADDAANNLGALAAREGRLEAARRWFRRALETNPEHEGAARNLRRLRAKHNGTVTPPRSR